MKQLLVPFLLCLYVFSFAQKVDITDENVNAMNFFKVVGGTPISSAKFSRLVEGTPYFIKDWMKGTITLSEGKEYPAIWLKLNLLENEVHYRDARGEEMISVTPMKKLVLTDTITKEKYTFINLRFLTGTIIQTDNWCQLLSEGNVSVLKFFRKHLDERIPYGSGLIEQTITNSPQYFILYNNQVIQTKKIKGIADIFPDRKTELLKYISEKKLDGKSDDDFVSVINYYNSLK